MSADDRDVAARIRRLLETEGEAIRHNTTVINDRHYEALDALADGRHEELRDRARSIKEAAIAALPELIEDLTASVEENGGTVHLAADAAEANRILTEIAAEANPDSVVKSKSMTSEEIEVNDHLEAAGVDVWETDLGELVIQLAGEDPSHIVGPSLHKSREEVAALFEARFDLEEPLETPEELTAFARDFLADRIEDADVGLTGANFLVAETGSIALLTNEGNARTVIEATDTHVAVAGVEKIVPELADLEPFVELVARSGNGQELTAYTSIFTPPVNTPSPSGDEREFHLVLIDNGRLDMREDEVLRETLYCVRCSACLNSCANFQHVGGHAFGGETYTGGIATGWEAGVHGLDSAADFTDLCTGCSRCVNQCPVKIDIPWLNAAVRDRVNRTGDDSLLDPLYEGLTPDAEPGGIDLGKRLFGNVETLLAVGSATAPVSNRLADFGPARAVLERLAGIDRRRDLPTVQRRTLRDWFGERDGGVSPADPSLDREVVLYPDVYTNYVDVERGKAAVRTLEALGVPVAIPDLPGSGRAPLSQGMIETARGQAAAVHAGLVPHLEAGRDVVVIEPSDLAMFRTDYEKLLPAAAFEPLAERSYGLLEYVYGLLVQEGVDPSPLSGPADTGGERVTYHPHCQGRTLGVDEHAVAVLETLGYAVETTSVECCGMAGSFGYKRQYYDLSMAVGASLRDQLREVPADHVLVGGTSCGEQLEALLEADSTHVAELIAPR